MSFFAKILSRAATPGFPQAPLAYPKGSSVLDRLDAGEEELAQPLRRQQEEEEEIQTLRRQEEGEEEVQTLHRQEEEEEIQPLRRRAEEEEVQTSRRQEEEVQPLRRQEEEEEIQPLLRQEEEEASPLRRVTPPEAEGLSAENSPQPDESASEPEMSAMQALRREATPTMPGMGTAALGTDSFTAPPPAPATPGLDAPGIQHPASHDMRTLEAIAQDNFIPAPHLTASASNRPRVIIDQIDVVIHEDTAAAAAPASSTADLGRAVKAKYLGGL